MKNPFIINKNNRTIKFHFDMMHGEGNLDKAIDLLETSDRKDFLIYVNSEVSFNPHNMFICKTKNILKKYYNSVFPWFPNCEKIFGFNLKGYGLQRIYGFLAERYMSFWFKKYTQNFADNIQGYFRLQINYRFLNFFLNSMKVGKFLSFFEISFFLAI